MAAGSYANKVWVRLGGMDEWWKRNLLAPVRPDHGKAAGLVLAWLHRIRRMISELEVY